MKIILSNEENIDGKFTVTYENSSHINFGTLVNISDAISDLILSISDIAPSTHPKPEILSLILESVSNDTMFKYMATNGDNYTLYRNTRS